MRTSRFSAFLFGTVAWLMAAAPAFAATTWTVTVATDTTTGVAANCPGSNCSLRDALAAAQNGDSIAFDGTAFASAQTIALGTASGQGQLTLSGNVTITGSPAGVVLDGGDATRIVYVNSGVTASIQGITFQNGNAVNAPNDGDVGGAIDNAGSLTVLDCTFTGNQATYGGAIQNGTSSESSPVLAVGNSTFFNNQAGQQGGAISNYGTLTVDNTTITGNSAPGSGAGTNSGFAGGIMNFNYSPYAGTATVYNSIVAGNSAGYFGQDVYGITAPASPYATNLVGSDGWQATINPQLAALGNYGGSTQTMPPLPGSPAIGIGQYQTGEQTTDQRGVSRPGGTIDAGSVQTNYTLTFSTQPGPTQTAGSPFSVAMTLSDSTDSAVPLGGVTITLTSGNSSMALVGSPLTATTGANGIATFGVTAYTATALSSASLVASAGALTATSSPFALSAGSPAFVVNTTGDTTNGIAANCAAGSATSCSLRDAVAAANSCAGTSLNPSLTFDSTVFATAQTITLATGSGQGQLVLTQSMTITGPAAGVSVNGVPHTAGSQGTGIRVFSVSSGTTVTLANMTIANGYSTYVNGDQYDSANPNDDGLGGAIVNRGILTVGPNMVFTNSTGDYGGAIANGGTLTITAGTVFNGNHGAEGGGALLNNGSYQDPDSTTTCGNSGTTGCLFASTIVQNSTFTGNTITGIYGSGGTLGGAIDNDGLNGSLTINGSLFSNNTGASTGGAISSYMPMTVTNSVFTGNTALSEGGALIVGPTSLKNVTTTQSLSNVTLAQNTVSSGSGGAIYATSSSTYLLNLTLGNVTANGNGATTTSKNTKAYGGAIYVTGKNSTMTLSNVTVSGNALKTTSTGSASGGGLYVASGTVNVANSIVAGNTAATTYNDVSGTLAENIGNLLNTASAVATTVNPQLGTLAGNGNSVQAGTGATAQTVQTMLPLPGSPAICAGTSSPTSPATLIASDQRGAARPNADNPGYTINPCVDAGAVQTHYALAFTTQPGNVVVNATMSPPPVVALSENGTAFTQASATINLGLSTGTGTVDNSSATTSTSDGTANWPTLSIDTVGTNDTLTAMLALNSNSSPAASVSTISNPFNVTPNVSVPGAPTIGTATAGNGQASVSFTPPTFNGGAPITIYTVTGSPGGATVVGTSSPLTVTGLTNGASYTFTVTATNSAGTGPASGSSNSVTPQASQTITFNNPGTQNFGTSPTLTATASSGLTVAFSSTTTGVCTVTSGGMLSFTSTGTCTIDASQSGNAGWAAAQTVGQSFTVVAVVPGAPMIGTATAGNGQASVSFTAPTFNGGAPITSYTATSSPSGITGTCTGSPCTVTGLTNGTSYTFTVTATNSAGTGPASAASNPVYIAPTLVVNTASDIGYTNAAGCDTGNSNTCSLRNALLAADLNASVSATIAALTQNITFDTTVFASAQTISLAQGQLVVQSNVSIQGPGANLLTVVGSASKQSVFYVQKNQRTTTTALSASLSGVTVSGGTSGGIYNLGTLTVDRSVVSGNSNNVSGATGGGINNQNSLTLTNSTVSGNTINGGTGGGSGAGIFNASTASLLAISNSTIANNAANGTYDSGGGIFNASGNGTFTLDNVTVTGNSAPAKGYAGGIYAFNVPITLNNSIVAGNTGGGSYTDLGVSSYPVPVINNSVCVGSSACKSPGTSIGLAALGNYGGTTPTMPPQPGSPVIGAGKFIAGESATDQIGNPRPSTVGATIDAGAVQGTTFALSFSVQPPSSVQSGSSFNVTVNAMNGNAALTGITPVLSLGTAGPTLTSSCAPTDASGNSVCLVTVTATAQMASETLIASYASNSATSSAFSVALPPAASFSVTAPTQVAAGASFHFTVQALAANGSATPNYSGTVHFTSSDSASNVVLPANATLTNGTGTFTATLWTPPAQTITATDTVNSSITGTSASIAVIAPTITSITPTSGPQGGGTGVSIHGSNFTGATKVMFGNQSVSFLVGGDSVIGVTSPPGTGTVDVTVTVGNATSATSTADQFTYLPTPSVTQVSPNQGPLGGGTSVSIGGANLAGVTTVYFGTTPASSFTVNTGVTPATITAIAPAGSAGAVDVTVTNVYGTSAPNPPGDQFTYVAAPTVTSVAPANGAVSGGTSVMITGSGFTGATAVNFGNNQPATTFTVTNDTSISAVSPAGSAGAVDVTVTTPGGTSAANPPGDQFTYIAPGYVVNTISDDDGTNALVNCNPATQATAQTCSLRDAIVLANAAATAPTITFDATVFPPNPASPTQIVLNADYAMSQGNDLVISAGMTIAGPGPQALELVATSENTGIYIQPPTQLPIAVVLSGLAITGAGSDAVDAGFYMALTLSNCAIIGNPYGGIVNFAAMSITDCTISGNPGGGIYNAGQLALIDSTIAGNSSTAENGGGYGGGIYHDAAPQFGNLPASSLTAINTTISANTASVNGGGIALVGGNVTLTNTIVSGNNEANGGADIATSTDNGTTFTNGGAYTDNGGNLVGAATIALAPLANYGGATQTMIALPGSSAICAGTSSPTDGTTTVPTVDQRGAARPNADAAGYSVDPCVDSGAVQTHYALSFAQRPSGVTIGATMTPAPAVALQENGTAFNATNYSSLSGQQTLGTVSISDAAGVMSAGSTTTATVDTASGVATFTNLGFSSAESSDSLNAVLQLNAVPPLSVTTSATSGSFAIAPNSAIVTLSNLDQTYTGSPLPVTVTTQPANLSVTVTYEDAQGNTSTTPPTNAGSYAVTASVTAPGYAGSASGTLTISAATQTLTFVSAPTIAIDGTGTVTVNATTPNSGNPVTLTSTTSDTCSIAIATSTASGASATVTGIAAGACKITANQAGGNDYDAATPVTQSIDIGVIATTLSLNATPNPVTQGKALMLTATVSANASAAASVTARFIASAANANAIAADATPPAGNVTFYVDGNAIGTAPLASGAASLSISTLAVGTHSITASYLGNDTYAAATTTQAIIVTVNAATGSQTSAVPAPMLSWWMLGLLGSLLAMVGFIRQVRAARE
jgi:CSLREA domain-containing protein